MNPSARAAVILGSAAALIAALIAVMQALGLEAPDPQDGEVTGLVYREHSGVLPRLFGRREGLVAEVGIDLLTDFASEGARLDLSHEEVSRRIDTSRYRTRSAADGTFALKPAPGPAIVCARTATASGCVEMQLEPPARLEIVVRDGGILFLRA